MSLSLRLEEGLAALGLPLSAETQTKLLAYLALLKKWNKTYNLTAIRDEAEMLTQHLLDSLSILPALQNSALAARRWADVGSGAGLPGIPLAIVRPDLEMSLIETVEKKSAFQRQAKIELALPNVTVISQRVEDLPGGQFDAVVSRAFAELVDFVTLAGHLLVQNGKLYAMKGLAAEAELKRVPPGWAVTDRIQLHVPGLDAQRHLIVIERA
ncbi:MAG: 16S rRNA (guanine(527)-N(7))-methyltransferase RsmG [Burkholderiaceae bacterium]|nr:16S rRNA (guanine(527)-N(7))-methyltransferase RsmG [Sulfuritalea sp.]MCF8175511.1 16S rRNA (guanine(527)-N(7))-methyltransferase RsmG [Burkholderiaceae bacterium]MCF8183401.1 16S rRNA (guanine(527)-N(7))-methyltransferase RsmG [Polynucleobacter sp.]